VVAVGFGTDKATGLKFWKVRPRKFWSYFKFEILIHRYINSRSKIAGVEDGKKKKNWNILLFDHSRGRDKICDLCKNKKGARAATLESLRARTCSAWKSSVTSLNR
jgi:hypothetical protein